MNASTALPTLINGAYMAPTKQQSPDSWFQREILAKVLEVKEGMDESLKLGRANGEAIRSLRLELGVDGAHGRLPQLEAAIARMDRAQETDHAALLKRVEDLETGESVAQGKKQVVAIIISIVCSSGFAVLAGWLAHQWGLVR